MADIKISDVTTTLIEGTGVFDILMRAIDVHLDKQYDSGRIKGSDYATVYLGALQSVLQQAIQFVLAEQNVEEQIAASQANTLIKQGISAKQEEVYIKQAQGFDRDYKFKIVKSLLDIRTTGLTQGIEGIASESGDKMIQELLTEVGLTYNAKVPATHTGQFLIDPV